jgi:hypothetical protein
VNPCEPNPCQHSTTCSYCLVRVDGSGICGTPVVPYPFNDCTSDASCSPSQNIFCVKVYDGATGRSRCIQGITPSPVPLCAI